MLIQELFRRSVVGRSQVTQDIVVVLAPRVLCEFAATPALGGSGNIPFLLDIQDDALQEMLASIPAYSVEELQKFSAKGFDQSLATHLINGLFAGMFLVERLPEQKTLDELEQRVWALGYTVHDYTKAYGRKVSAGQMPIIRRLVSLMGERLAFDKFLVEWREYLDDIVFIAQNTQTVQGANLNLRDYQLRLDKRQRETIRLLSSVTDLLVHITSPSDVSSRDVRGRDLAYNLREKLEWLFGADMSPHLAYHKLLEVRGLLSNLLNNALIDVLRQQQYEPFLFFPEGVIYLAPRHIQASIDPEALAKVVWRRIAQLLTGGRQMRNAENGYTEDDEDEEREEEEGLQIRRSKDYLKVPPILYELLTVESLLEAGRQVSMSTAVRNNRAIARFGAEQANEQHINLKGLSPKEKEKHYLQLGSAWALEQHFPTDIRVDQLAEYLAFLYRRIFAELFPKLQGSTAMLLTALDLDNEVPPERAERQRGGTPTGWFYAAACYIKKHPELAPDELETVMKMLADRSLEYIITNGFSLSDENPTARIFQTYAWSVIEIDGQIVGCDQETMRERFASELLNYMQGKEDNNVLCSLCSSPYRAREQDASTVLFMPQQYSNKSPLNRSRMVRGICPICALEMLLRQTQQGLPASKTQNNQPINLYLYPTYFFTTETAKVIKQFSNRLQNLDLRRLIFSHLEREGFHHQALLSYEDFLVDDDDLNQAPLKAFRKLPYSDEDLAALFFITLHPLGDKKKLTETDTWIVPTFFTLALPLLLGVKCVATPSFVALHKSASDFQETVRLDGAHEFMKYILPAERFRIDELPRCIERLLRVYSLHIDVYAKSNNYHWGQLTNLAKDLATDPLYVFQYYDRRQRRDAEDAVKGKGAKQEKRPVGSQVRKGISHLDQQRYMNIYFAIGGDIKMGFIGELVDAYAQFYRANKHDSAYAVLRPLGTAIDVVVKSNPSTDQEDLLLLVAGAVNDDQERVRSDQAEGFDPIVTKKELGDYPTRLALSREKIKEFARLFLKACFADYCNSDRAILRERANRIRSAARFYYLSEYTRK